MTDFTHSRAARTHLQTTERASARPTSVGVGVGVGRSDSSSSIGSSGGGSIARAASFATGGGGAGNGGGGDERRAFLPSDLSRGFLSARGASLGALGRDGLLNAVVGSSGVDARIHRWSGARLAMPVDDRMALRYVTAPRALRRRVT